MSGQLGRPQLLMGLQLVDDDCDGGELVDPARRDRRSLSRKVPSHPVISSRPANRSFAGRFISREGEGARPSLRTLAPCPLRATRFVDWIPLRPAAIAAQTYPEVRNIPGQNRVAPSYSQV